MITHQTLMTYAKAAPFRPFRINMASGKIFEVRHPEMIKAGKSYFVVFTYVNDNPDLLDHWETGSLLLTESLSHLDTPVSQR